MKQKYSYTECYRILTIRPDCTWEELRKVYKQQIQKWHPDRYRENSAERLSADEKIKHITAAYQQLASYYRQHNSLPDIEQPRLESRESITNSRTESASHQPHYHYQPAPILRTRQKKSPLFMGIGIVMLALFIWLQHTPTNERPVKQASKTHNFSAPKIENHEIKKNIDPNEATNPYYSALPTSKSEKLITYGSSVGEVIAIQGVPSHQEGDIWYYGESEIYFKHGTVTGWKRAPNSDLKVSLIPQQQDAPQNQRE